MPGMSIHVVDIARGAVAAGMRVRVERIEAEGPVLVAQGRVGSNGLVAAPELAALLPAGVYEASFAIGDYLRAIVAPSTSQFLDVAPFRFTLSDPQSHCHLPFKFTAYGFSCFRGAE